MAAAVERHYPEREGDLPEDSREGFVPGFILDSIQRQQRLEEARERNKRARLTEEKQATPGTGGRTPEASLDEVRPFSITNSVSTSAASEPVSIREGALNKFGDLEIATRAEAITQWDSKYFSQVLPFVLPYMVSGPDYHPTQR